MVAVQSVRGLRLRGGNGGLHTASAQQFLQPDHDFRKEAFPIAGWKRHSGIIKNSISVGYRIESSSS